ncbi:hypothetical protein [Luteolibacter soli]|uniref:DUF3592 domain-containing protein n=1 Tax=Luteolibacter soli TaxID=3135280 RepID=A0ABU9AVX3_9BACT
MKLALHRSMIFWSGLLAVGFVCWAWHDSYFLNRFANHRGYGISHMNGGIAMAKITTYFGTRHGSMNTSTFYRMETFPPPLFIRSEVPPGGTRPKAAVPDLHPPFTVKESWTITAKSESGSTRIFIPYWLILSFIALLWLALLLWRAKRRSTRIKV